MNSPSCFMPTGTVYGVLLNSQNEWEAWAPQMTQPPYQAPPKAPVLYIKPANTWSAQGAPIPVPGSVLQVEIGATIGMVMGPPAHKNKASSAMDLVAGYVLMNDLSVPHTSFFRPPVKYKCLDGFLGVGPHLVAPAQAGDPATLQLEVRINGELSQVVDFSRMVRSAGQLLADVGEFMTLRAGDVLMLGCDVLAGGGRPLARVGDRIEMDVPAVPAFGTLSNTLVAEGA